MVNRRFNELGANYVKKNLKAEAEVKRLDQLKASMMKELFIKKQKELEDICNKSHMEIPSRLEMEKIINLINSGTVRNDINDSEYHILYANLLSRY